MTKEYYQANKERLQAKFREYYQANKERCKRKRIEYIRKHPKEVAAYQAEYRKKYRDTINAKQRVYNHSAKGQEAAYRWRHSEKGKAYNRQCCKQYRERCDKDYKLTFSVGKMIITFKKINRLYYYFTWFKGNSIQSNPFQTYKECKQAARAFIS